MNLSDLLHDLVDTGTPVDPAADVARGRRRLRRRGTVVAGGSALGLLAIAGAGIGLVHAAHRGPAYAGSPTDPTTVAVAPTTAPPTAPSSPSSGPSAAASTTTPSLPRDPHARLQVWRDVVADHLDPADVHLQKAPSSIQSGSSGKDAQTLGTKLDWSGGAHGHGMVEVTGYGGGDWSTLGAFGDWGCPAGILDQQPGWHCFPEAPPTGAVKAVYATYPGGRAAAVEHADGTIVVLDVDQSFGNNGTIDTEPIRLSRHALIETAADPSLTVAGLKDAQPPRFARR